MPSGQTAETAGYEDLQHFRRAFQREARRLTEIGETKFFGQTHLAESGKENRS